MTARMGPSDKASKCVKCGKRFVIHTDSIGLAKTHCWTCRTRVKMLNDPEFTKKMMDIVDEYNQSTKTEL